jgi:hypothetical protein
MRAEFLVMIQRAYDEVHTALWGALVAFLLFFPVAMLPQIKAGRAALDAQVASEISAENDSYCRRFRFVPSTPDYRSCLDELQRLRSSIEKRIAADYEF